MKGGDDEAQSSRLRRPEVLGLTVGRVALGLIWLTQLFWKLPPTFGCPADFAVSTSFEARTTGLCDWFGLMAAYSTLPIHGEVIRAVVLPNVVAFSWLVFLAETFLAISLTLGLLTRLGAALGLAMSVNFLVGLSAVPHEWWGTYTLMIALHAIFLLLSPQRTLGVDRYLRWPGALRFLG